MYMRYHLIGGVHMTLEELSKRIETGETTCTALTEEVLQRIAENDTGGRKLNSVCCLNPDALFQARAIDAEIRRNGRKSPLHGIPVLVKDNIDVKGMITTAGSTALADNLCTEDAVIVQRLKEAGALILGKANLSEFAYWMSRQDMPSGYSSYSGQVIHAWVPGIDPSGSSSGSAVAVSARLIPFAIGTETDGSLMSPSIANAIISVKPTVGLVPRTGILPLSCIQDTAGPMCTSVQDCADVLQVLAGYDENDTASYNACVRDYRSALHIDGKGLKIGILRQDCDETALQTIDEAVSILQEAGAEVQDIEIDTVRQDESECLMHEFKHDINVYLHQHHSKCQSLADIIAYNKAHAETCLVHGQDLLEASEAKSGRLIEKEYIEKRMELRKTASENLDGTLKKYRIDVILSAGARPKGNLSPISGNPCMSLPAIVPDERDYKPCSWYLMAGAYREDHLLHTAYILEQKAGIHTCPSWTEEFR